MQQLKTGEVVSVYFGHPTVTSQRAGKTALIFWQLAACLSKICVGGDPEWRIEAFEKNRSNELQAAGGAQLGERRGQEENKTAFFAAVNYDDEE